MGETTDFRTDYFIQTRREIDTEKHSRDQILNFAVVVLGAIAFAIFRSSEANVFLTKPFAIIPECSALLMISALFWVRRKKLEQIADRWFVLHNLAEELFGEERAKSLLEGMVCKQLTRRRYIKKDLFLNFALSSPIYTLLFIHLSGFWTESIWQAVASLAVVVLHVVLSAYILGRRFRRPSPR